MLEIPLTMLPEGVRIASGMIEIVDGAQLTLLDYVPTKRLGVKPLNPIARPQTSVQVIPIYEYDGSFSCVTH